MTRLLLITLTCIIFLLTTPYYTNAEAPGEERTVLIGVILPLSGATALWGEDPRKGLELLEKRVNAKPNRFEYRFIFEDGRCGKGNAAITAAKKLIHVNKVAALVLGCSGETLQVGPLAEELEVVTMCFACSHSEIKHLGEFVFRTYVDIENGMKKFAKLLSTKHGSDIAILTEENSFTLGIKDLLLRFLPARPTFVDDFTEEEQDFRSLILKAKARNPKGYYLNTASPSSYQNLLRQLKELGINQPIYSYHQPGNQDSISILGALQNGVVFLDVPDVRETLGYYRDFYEVFLSEHPAGANLDFLLRTSVEAAYTLIESIESVGLDSKNIRDFLYSVDRPGALGRLRFDRNGDIIGLNFTLKKIVEGQPKELNP